MGSDLVVNLSGAGASGQVSFPLRPWRSAARRAEPDLAREIAAFERLEGLDQRDPERLHDVVGATARLCLAILKAEVEGVAPDEIRDRLAGVRAMHARSPFVRRLQEWPRGYAGDFETIEYILESRVRAPAGTLEYWIESASLIYAIAQQHRNKVAAQAAMIEQTVREKRTAARILVLAAGSAPDVRRVEHCIRRNRATVVLNDSDGEALSFALSKMPALAPQILTVKGNVFTSLHAVAEQGPFDLVVAGGLFDYLPDRHAAFLIRNTFERLLAPGGRFFFTNVNRPNVYRPLIEYIGNWHLIERTEHEIGRIVLDACGKTVHAAYRHDRTCLAILTTLTNADLRRQATH